MAHPVDPPSRPGAAGTTTAHTNIAAPPPTGRATHRATAHGGWLWVRLGLLVGVIGLPTLVFWAVMRWLFDVEFAFLIATLRLFSLKVVVSTLAIIKASWHQVALRFTTRRGTRWFVRLMAILVLPQSFRRLRRPARWLWRQVRGGLRQVRRWHGGLAPWRKAVLWTGLALASIGIAVTSGWLWLLLPPALLRWLGRKATDLLPDTVTRLGGWERRLERRALRFLYRRHRRAQPQRRPSGAALPAAPAVEPGGRSGVG